MVPHGFPLTRSRLETLLALVGSKRIAVVGDFHLDVYWHADMRRARLSRETPHFARPVVEERYNPGVGGVIAANLRALGVGTVFAVGARGDDWRGQVLADRLEALGCSVGAFRVVRGRITPTYIKPMVHGYESSQEDPRLDFQDARDLPPPDESRLLADLDALLPDLDAIAVIDQIEEDEGGVVSANVRSHLARIGAARPALPLLADSRARIGAFRSVMVKVNRLELGRALGRDPPRAREDLLAMGGELAAKTGRAVFVSAGADGMVYVAGADRVHVPAVPVRGPIDPVGAGDSASAGIASALACGATIPEAIAFANLVASVTIGKLGETGTASPEELRAAYDA